MNTYKLSANSKKRLTLLEEPSKKFNCKRHRCVVTTRRKLSPEQLEGIVVHEHYDGDCFKEMGPWADKSIVEELEEQNQEMFPVPLSKQTRARDRWEQATLDLDAAKKSVIKATKRQESAARNLLLTNGKVPVYLGIGSSNSRELHDPTFIREIVMWLRRAGG